MAFKQLGYILPMKYKFDLLVVILLYFSIFTPVQSPANVGASQSWSPIEIVSTGSSGNSLDANIAVDDEYNIHIVWREGLDHLNSGTDSDIFYRMYDKSNGFWLDAYLVSENSNGDSYEPRIQIDSKGTVHIIWTEAISEIGIYHRTFDVKAQLLSEITLITTESNRPVSYPSFIIDNSDNIHVVWMDATDYQGAGLEYDIFYKKFLNETQSWTPSQFISTESSTVSYNPDIAIDQNENLHVVWYDYSDYAGSGIDRDIFYKRYENSAGFWSSTEVISEGTGASFSPNIEIDSKGNLYVVWQDDSDYTNSGLDLDIFLKKFDKENQIWEPMIVVSTESDQYSTFSDIKIDENDVVHIVWEDMMDLQGAGIGDDIFYKTLSGSELSGPQLVSPTPTNASRPKMYVDKSQGIHVIWSDSTDFNGIGTDFDIVYRILPRIPDRPHLNEIPSSSDQFVQLSWDEQMEASTYRVYRSNNPIYTKEIEPYMTVPSNYFVDEVSESGTYYYAIKATNIYGESQLSNLVFSNKALPPTVVQQNVTIVTTIQGGNTTETITVTESDTSGNSIIASTKSDSLDAPNIVYMMILIPVLYRFRNNISKKQI